MPQKVADLISQDSSKDSWFRENVVSRAPTIIMAFSNFVVIFADVRAYHVVFKLTGIWWQALAASLACAIPFILWEIGWQYNNTTDGWRRASLGMAGLAFATSIVLGVADYVGMTSLEWTNLLLGGVVIMTGIHTIVGFLYFYNDPDVARKRRKAQALATMEDQRINAEVARTLLREGSDLLRSISSLEDEFDSEDVEAVLGVLRGKKGIGKSKGNPM